MKQKTKCTALSTLIVISIESVKNLTKKKTNNNENMVLMLYYNDSWLIMNLWLCIFDIFQLDLSIRKTYEKPCFKLFKYFDHKQEFYHTYKSWVKSKKY